MAANLKTKSSASLVNPFFFIFDFYMMQGASDDNDVLPEAILYFYPIDEQAKTQKLLECGELVGMVQYFQHDLFRSISRTFHFDKTLVVHEHYGRHSGFLVTSHDTCVEEEARIHLKNIMNIFNILYGTWNHVQGVYGTDKRMNTFLNQALTPIVNYVLNQPRSIPYLFSTIGYTPLKKENGKVLLECKHCIDYLKLMYGMKNGLLGYDRKILYSSFDIDTNYSLQFIFQLRNELPDDLICIPWDSDFKLKNGVSLFRLYLPRSSQITTDSTSNINTTTTEIHPPATPPKMITLPINILDDSATSCDESLSLRNRFYNDEFSPSLPDRRRRGMLIPTDQSGSSEERGFDTDTMDESSSISAIDDISVSSLSNSEPSCDIVEQNLFEVPLTDEQKIENLRSRSSTLSNDMEKTIEIDYMNNTTETIDRIHITQIDSFENSDDDNIEDFQIIHRRPHPRTATVTSNSDAKKVDFLKSDRHEMLVSWTNIPDRNNEQERDELVLYVQRNSRMAFAGVMEQKLLTDEYLKTLWNFMLTQMAHMESEIHAVSTANEVMKLFNDARFQFNENTCNAEFEQAVDGVRTYRKLPTDESSYMAFLARTELNRDPDRKIIGLSRGSHLVTADRRLPDRTIYSPRRIQD
ncbi:hypothetical protein I4U23_025880 [Adineta vaga]|nr:hypothetical protein I4U23_025880 [Adineta vaga]